MNAKSTWHMACTILAVLIAGNVSGWTAYSYVQKGLKASYDGIDNTGTGVHDASSAIWKDLTGNGYDGTLASTVSATGTSTSPVRF